MDRPSRSVSRPKGSRVRRTGSSEPPPTRGAADITHVGLGPAPWTRQILRGQVGDATFSLDRAGRIGGQIAGAKQFEHPRRTLEAWAPRVKDFAFSIRTIPGFDAAEGCRRQQ
jgi:hypothetical protein